MDSFIETISFYATENLSLVKKKWNMKSPSFENKSKGPKRLFLNEEQISMNLRHPLILIDHEILSISIIRVQTQCLKEEIKGWLGTHLLSQKALFQTDRGQTTTKLVKMLSW